MEDFNSEMRQIQMLISAQDAIRNSLAFFVCIVDDEGTFKSYYSSNELNLLEVEGFESMIKQCANSLEPVSFKRIDSQEEDEE